MPQINKGIRAILSHPLLYDALQRIMGAMQVRINLVKYFVRPFPGARILDIGCGTAAILSYLPNSVTYWGFDISREYIESAKSRFGTRGTFHCCQISLALLKKLPKFDVVLAIGVLHHLEDSIAIKLFSLACEALNKEGRLVTIDPCFAVGQNPIANYIIRYDRGQNVRNADDYRLLASKIFPNVIGELHHRRWIPYTHWIMECSA